MALKIYAEYKKWDEKACRIFLKNNRYHRFFEKWSLIKDYLPSFNKIHSGKNIKLQREDALRMFEDMEKLRSILKEKEIILTQFEEQVVVPVISKISEIKIINNYLMCGTVKMPIRSGQKAIMDFFLKNPKKIKKGNVLSKGKPIPRIDLEEYGHYDDEDSFRSALKKLRMRLREYKMPLSIESAGKNLYILEIKME